MFLLGSGATPSAHIVCAHMPSAPCFAADFDWECERAVCALFEGGMYSFVFQWVRTPRSVLHQLVLITSNVTETMQRTRAEANHALTGAWAFRCRRLGVSARALPSASLRRASAPGRSSSCPRNSRRTMYAEAISPRHASAQPLRQRADIVYNDIMTIRMTARQLGPICYLRAHDWCSCATFRPTRPLALSSHR